VLTAAAIVLAGGAWRAVLAERMPSLARDGVLYIDFARAMERDGVDALRDPRFQQHPLYSAGTLAIHRALRLAGMADTPETWQRAGQSLAWLSGVALIIACGWLALRVRSELQIDLPAASTALCAMVFAAILPLNTWLSADVMSDQLHALLYVLAITAGLRAGRSTRAAILTGLLGGLAFLVRPEGAVVCLAAGISLFVGPRRSIVQGLPRGACLTACFLLIAAPYWLAIGGLTPKLEKETIDGFRIAILEPGGVRSPVLAALVRQDVSWATAGVLALYTLLRAGRVIVPVLAFGALVRSASRWRSPALFVPLCAAAIHGALANVLLVRHGYLAPRHMLVIVLVLIPWAGLALTWVIGRCQTNKLSWVAWLVSGAIWLPLAGYATRVPNGADHDVASVGRWLASSPPAHSSDVLLGGASERRIAFYGGVQWHGWPENEADPGQRYDGLCSHLLGVAPTYFAITTGGGTEVRENGDLLDALLVDPLIGPRLRELHVEPGDPDGAVYLFRFE
jgi:hypothetical protein